jgi:hypothetical protein
MNQQTHETDTDEFITLIGADMDEIHAAYRAQGLAERHYAIVHRTGRHRFSRVSGSGSETMFDGEPMIAATFWRRSGC